MQFKFENRKVSQRSNDAIIKLLLNFNFRPKINSNIEINIDFNENISYFIKTIVGHGNIIQNEMIRLEKKQNSTTFKVLANNEMIPDFYVFVHYMIGRDMKYCESRFTLPDVLENQV